MSTTQPIRNLKKLQEFKTFYRKKGSACPNGLRNDTLSALGLHTALRVTDILYLTWKDVMDGKKVKTHLIVKERKTGKENRILLNGELRKILVSYHKEEFQKGRRDEDFLFPSPRRREAPLSRFQAYRIIRNAAEGLGIEHISCHSLRKTFGYHAWKQGTQPALLMSIFNHSSWNITLRYLGISQDEKDEVYARILY